MADPNPNPNHVLGTSSGPKGAVAMCLKAYGAKQLSIMSENIAGTSHDSGATRTCRGAGRGACAPGVAYMQCSEYAVHVAMRPGGADDAVVAVEEERLASGLRHEERVEEGGLEPVEELLVRVHVLQRLLVRRGGGAAREGAEVEALLDEQLLHGGVRPEVVRRARREDDHLPGRGRGGVRTRGTRRILARTPGDRLGGGRRQAAGGRRQAAGGRRGAAVTENMTRKRRYKAKLFPALISCSSVRPSISASSFARFALTTPLTRLRRLTIGRAAAGPEPLRPEPLRWPEPLRPVPLRLGAGSSNSSASPGSSGSANSGGSLSTKPTLGPRLGPPPVLFFLLPARTA
eukprot:scaffold93027_cov54-Phaeocystis_antarctica.AAC.1